MRSADGNINPFSLYDRNFRVFQEKCPLHSGWARFGKGNYAKDYVGADVVQVGASTIEGCKFCATKQGSDRKIT